MTPSEVRLDGVSVLPTVVEEVACNRPLTVNPDHAGCFPLKVFQSVEDRNPLLEVPAWVIPSVSAPRVPPPVSGAVVVIVGSPVKPEKGMDVAAPDVATI